RRRRAHLRRRFRVRGRRRRRRLRLRRRWAARSLPRRWQRLGGALSERQSRRGRPSFHPAARSSHGPHSRERRLSHRHRRRWDHRPRGAPEWRERPPPRPRRLPFPAREREMGFQRADRRHDGVQRDVGGRRDAAGEAPSLYTADDGWVTVQVEGMGIASYDLTGDGYPEVFLTSQADNRLQTLAGGPSQPTYRDIGQRRGANAARPFTGGDTRPSTAWHDEFADVNNDGFVDLFISKGNVT